MAIEYVVIRNTAREIVGIVDTAKSIIWHSVYYGVGDFEIYAPATDAHISLLKKGYYVTRPDDLEVGVIEKIEVTKSIQDGGMIIASGRFAKSLLNRRLIYQLTGTSNKPTVLRGNVETNIRKVVSDNIISCPWNIKRNISIIELGAVAGITKTIVDENGKAAEKQVSYQNLQEYTDEVLQEYEMASMMTFNDANNKLQFVIYEGVDRSVDNSVGNEPIVFSKEYDNLIESDYSIDDSKERTVALVGGEGEGTERFYSVFNENLTGLQRKELWVDASSLNKDLGEEDLQELFPSGSFSGLNFVVGGVVYATLIVDLEKEYSLSSLQDKFPTGTVSGTKFNVGGVTYANQIYGETTKYTLTALGYKAVLEKEEKEGTYRLSDDIYSSMLKALGKQEVAPLKVEESFNGTINTANGQWVLNRDFTLGDIVTVQDNQIGIYANVRVVETTEVQDENGYSAEVNYA